MASLAIIGCADQGSVNTAVHGLTPPRSHPVKPAPHKNTTMMVHGSIMHMNSQMKPRERLSPSQVRLQRCFRAAQTRRRFCSSLLFSACLASFSCFSARICCATNFACSAAAALLAFFWIRLSRLASRAICSFSSARFFSSSNRSRSLCRRCASSAFSASSRRSWASRRGAIMFCRMILTDSWSTASGLAGDRQTGQAGFDSTAVTRHGLQPEWPQFCACKDPRYPIQVIIEQRENKPCSQGLLRRSWVLRE